MLTTMLEVPGPIGGYYAFDDHTRWDDGTAWDDVQVPVLANSRPSAFYGIEGLLERSPSLKRSAARIMGL